MDKWLLSKEEEERALAQAMSDKLQELQRRQKTNPAIIIPEHWEFDEDQRKQILEKANRSKGLKLHFEHLEKIGKEARKKIEADLIAAWDYRRFYREMVQEHDRLQQSVPESKRRAFLYNETTERLIKAICFRLSRDSRYETELGFSFNKLLLIRGEPGLGKSYIPSLVAENPVCPIQIITMHEIVRSVMESGNFQGFKFAQYDIIYLDDVGTEFEKDGKPAKYMGNSVNFFRIWFEEYYAKAKHKMGKLIFSTNDNFQVMEEKYGFRVRERLAECADVLDIHGKSFRR